MRASTRYLYAVGAHLAFLLVWQAATMLTDVPAYILPSPVAAFAELWEPSSGCRRSIRR
jgi:ABC-type nitrate/sulfonate/bicarbonate transport system permease component